MTLVNLRILFLLHKVSGHRRRSQWEVEMSKENFPAGFQDALNFPLFAALLGRRSRRFFMGADIPDGVFAYESRHNPLPLTDLEKMLIVSACGRSTSWHNMIFRGAHYAPYLAN